MMDTPLLTAAFWQSRDVHVALPPHMAEAPAGLLESAGVRLPEGGCLFLTSGTTGPPKWVALEKRALLHSAKVVNARYNINASDRSLIPLPLHHVGGFSILARCYLSGSECHILLDKWNPEAFRGALSDRNITVTSMVPTQLHDVVARNLRAPPSLRLVMVGGGRLPTPLMLDALRLGWPVCATYGLTEAASQVASQPLEHDRLNDPETLEILPHWHANVTTEGRLNLRGPSLAKGYLRADAATIGWEPISSEHGLTTHDHVKLWHDGTRGFMRFLTRDETLLKIVGERVSLEMLEQRLADARPPGMPDFALAALPDARREHRLILAMEPGGALPRVENWLDAYHRQSQPFERIEAWCVVPRLPRTDLGKLSRSKLAAQVAELPSRSASPDPARSGSHPSSTPL